MRMRRGAAGLLLGIVVMLAGAQPASSASCWFGCKTPPTTKAPTPAPSAPAPAPALAPAPAPAPAAFDPASAAQRILELTNRERAAVGLPGLSMRGDVVAIAQAQSAAMAAAGTIWHNDSFLTQATRAALAANMLGENVGMGPNVDQVHVALMNSPGHKANILEPAFSIVGMAVTRSGDGMVYVTQDFLQPSGRTPRPATAVKAAAPKPAPKPRVATAPKLRVASTPAPAAPATTAAPPTTEAPAATTTTVAAQPNSSVLAAFGSAPLPQPAPTHRSGANGMVVLLAFALVAASATGAMRLRLTRRA
jgi:uncharacterized protein YkwD